MTLSANNTIVLEGEPTWSRSRNIGHYGGALDKANNKSEGRVPYAWVFYLELRYARGSAYAVWDGTLTGLVHSENLGLARSEGLRWRAANRFANNSNPSTADEKLESWVKILGIETYPQDTRQDIRTRAAAKYYAALGPTARVVDDAVQALLGDVFVRSWRQVGTNLATPPTQTFWPVENTGPAAYSLGGGAWLSERSHYVVEVQQPSTMPLIDFLTLLNVHLFRLLDQLLPAWVTFDWAIGLSDDGFTLDIDQLDFAGMIP